MTNLKPRIRLIDLNELEEMINSLQKSYDNKEGCGSQKIYDILFGEIESLKSVHKLIANPSKTKDLLSKVYDEGMNDISIDDKNKDEYLNNLIL